ncbi:uncharacterized protein TRIADDRAFT_56600 [Trichoplax adhaerens]|uniref:G-protein coupled receptors family 1 profile domain-containing protein n=1 Tax=Trichoplax adhaerens TaxID=10228 RepID=B3RYL5_TRIAD|nr:hypothetical protein TRIADDRAFT_56600 [Trichoplax adhaerens]EDV24618.1 hypothetical protein TRIADDRAFT_56600 [Trichoplax adhaerens]|eukprot:XP_002112508.1 hypothetical protein TRIADDRAFT_56600 [Trichoplax adhaerens]
MDLWLYVSFKIRVIFVNAISYVSNNNIRTLKDRFFEQVPHLQLLSIANNPLLNISSESFFGPAQLSSIFSTRDYLCCIVPAKVTHCIPLPDQDSLSTCNNILPHFTLQLFVWIIGIAALIGSIMVLIRNHCFYSNRSNRKRVPVLLISNLAVVDLLMALYLLIIAIADQYYRGFYGSRTEKWLTSIPCYFACFLVSLSSLMSVYTIGFICLDRYIHIGVPFAQKFLTMQTAQIALGIGWLFSIIFVIIPVANSVGKYGDQRIYKYSSVCVPSNVENLNYRKWLATFTLLTLIIWIMTATIYILFLISLKTSRKLSNRNIDRGEKRLTLRILLIVVTNFSSWMPYYILIVQFLWTGWFNIYALQFIAIFALPLNAALNPYLYTFTNPAVTYCYPWLQSKFRRFLRPLVTAIGHIFSRNHKSKMSSSTEVKLSSKVIFQSSGIYQTNQIETTTTFTTATVANDL